MQKKLSFLFLLLAMAIPLASQAKTCYLKFSNPEHIDHIVYNYGSGTVDLSDYNAETGLEWNTDYGYYGTNPALVLKSGVSIVSVVDQTNGYSDIDFDYAEYMGGHQIAFAYNYGVDEGDTLLITTQGGEGEGGDEPEKPTFTYTIKCPSNVGYYSYTSPSVPMVDYNGEGYVITGIDESYASSNFTIFLNNYGSAVEQEIESVTANGKSITGSYGNYVIYCSNYMEDTEFIVTVVEKKPKTFTVKCDVDALAFSNSSTGAAISAPYSNGSYTISSLTDVKVNTKTEYVGLYSISGVSPYMYVVPGINPYFTISNTAADNTVYTVTLSKAAAVKVSVNDQNLVKSVKGNGYTYTFVNNELYVPTSRLDEYPSLDIVTDGVNYINSADGGNMTVSFLPELPALSTTVTFAGYNDGDELALSVGPKLSEDFGFTFSGPTGLSITYGDLTATSDVAGSYVLEGLDASTIASHDIVIRSEVGTTVLENAKGNGETFEAIDGVITIPGSKLPTVSTGYVVSYHNTTVTLKINDLYAIKGIYPTMSNGMGTAFIFDSNNEYTLDITTLPLVLTGGDEDLQYRRSVIAETNPGYAFSGLTSTDDRATTDAEFSTNPTYITFFLENVKDGDVIEISTKALELPKLTFLGPSGLNVTYNYTPYNYNAGVGGYVVDNLVTTYFTEISISANEGSNIVVKKVVSEDGLHSFDASGGVVTFSTSALFNNPADAKSITFNIETAEAAAKVKASLTVMDENAFRVGLYVANTNVYVGSVGTPVEFEFDPESDEIIIRDEWGLTLGKLIVDGVTIDSDFSSITLIPGMGGYPQEGSEIQVYVMPVVDKSHFTFEFANGNDEVLSYVRTQYYALDREEWLEGYECNEGSYLKLEFNIQDYVIKQFTVNGEDFTEEAQSGEYEIESCSGDYEFYIDAVANTGRAATINCNVPDQLVIKDQDNNVFATVSTQSEEISIPNSVDFLRFAVSDTEGYVLSSVEIVKSAGEQPEPVVIDERTFESDPIREIEGGWTFNIVITAKSAIEPIVRDRELVVYLNADDSWTSARVDLTPAGRDRNDWTSVALNPGFNIVNFSEEDVPFQMLLSSNEGTGEVYINDSTEAIEAEGQAVTISDVEDGDILYIYAAGNANARETFNVSYQLMDDAPVAFKVSHHGKPVVAGTGHQLRYGSEIWIEIEQSEAASIAEDKAILAAYINGQVKKADENGVIKHTIVSDSEIQVVYDLESIVDGIGSISIDNIGNNEIYNLQGIRVNSDNLPAGIYIINGKKHFIR